MAYKRFIVLLGIFLGGFVPATAQTPAPRFVVAHQPVAPTTKMFRSASTPSLKASFLPIQDPEKFPAHFSYLFAEANDRDYSTERLPPTDDTKTLLFTQSSLPLVQLWSGRLQFDAFQNTIRVQNTQLDPLGYGGALDRHPRQTYPGGPRSVDLSGISLSFRFGRDTRSERPAQPWRRISRIIGNVLH